MADTKISQLPAATALSGTEVVPLVQSGVTVGATVTQLRGTVMTNPMTTVGDIIIGGSGGTPVRLGIGTNGQVPTVSGGTLVYATPAGSGTVTSVSVVSANGFGGTVATSTTTPAITLTTSLTGLLKGNGTAMSAATAGTDYLTPPSGTAILKANSGGALANATAGTDYLAPPAGTSILKANSGGALANAVAGTDYPGLASANTFTNTQVYSDQQISRGMMKDMGVVFLDKGNSGVATQTLDYTAAGHQKVTATGNFTIALSNFPPTGNLGEILLELTNGGAFTLTWPTVNWVKTDGSFTTTFASNGVALQASGTDFCLIWSRDGGTTYYGKFMR